MARRALSATARFRPSSRGVNGDGLCSSASVRGTDEQQLGELVDKRPQLILWRAMLDDKQKVTFGK